MERPENKNRCGIVARLYESLLYTEKAIAEIEARMDANKASEEDYFTLFSDLNMIKTMTLRAYEIKLEANRENTIKIEKELKKTWSEELTIEQLKRQLESLEHNFNEVFWLVKWFEAEKGISPQALADRSFLAEQIQHIIDGAITDYSAKYAYRISNKDG